MNKYQPYKNWKREDLYLHCAKQAREFNFDVIEIKKIIFDKRWNPAKEYNGCSLVQDPLHPFYPCLRHDYDWIVGVGGIDADKRFYNNLKKAGMLTIKAKIWFVGVRLGWVIYYKWVHKAKNKKK